VRGLATHKPQQVFRISRALHGDLGCGAFDLPQIIGCQFERARSKVFIQPVKFCGAGNGNDPRLLRQQPRKGDLSGRYVLSFRDRAEQIDQSLVRFSSFRRKARNAIAEVGARMLKSVLRVVFWAKINRRKRFVEFDV